MSTVIATRTNTILATIRSTIVSTIKVPDDLFKDAEVGTFLDFRPEYTYTDTAGTTPAGAGDFIANAGDRSPNSANAVQATSAARWQLLQTGGGVYYASTDETDDVLPVTLPAITGGTVALIGLSGIYYEEDWDYAGGTLNIGPTSVPGLPAGILDVVGGLCAVLITDRALTSAEKSAVSAWGKARGAAGVFELGPEIIDLTPDDIAANWTNNGDGSYTSNGGTGYLRWLGLSPGEYHLVSVAVQSRTSGNVLGYIGSPWEIGLTTAGSAYLGFLRCREAIGRLDIYSNSFLGTIDNISVRKLELVP